MWQSNMSWFVCAKHIMTIYQNIAWGYVNLVVLSLSQFIPAIVLVKGHCISDAGVLHYVLYDP